MKTNAHTVYKIDGETVPSVTTVLNILAKPALIHWAWKLGTEGQDYKAVRDQAADVGTLAHYLIMCHLRNVEADTSEYSAQDINQAENCFLKYLDWEREHQVEPLLVEEPMVSRIYKYGGTIDCLARHGDELWLIDHKTGKAIYPEMFCQLAAYKQLLTEYSSLEGRDITSARILRIGRDEAEGFEERVVDNLDRYFQKFYHCLQIYHLDKIK